MRTAARGADALLSEISSTKTSSMIPSLSSARAGGAASTAATVAASGGFVTAPLAAPLGFENFRRSRSLARRSSSVAGVVTAASGARFGGGVAASGAGESVNASVRRVAPDTVARRGGSAVHAVMLGVVVRVGVMPVGAMLARRQLGTAGRGAQPMRRASSGVISLRPGTPSTETRSACGLESCTQNSSPSAAHTCDLASSASTTPFLPCQR